MKTVVERLEDLERRLDAINRRVESPEPAPPRERPGTEEVPEPDLRDGEQTANVVRVLEWVRGITWQNSPHVRAAMAEAIRRVKAHDRVREYLKGLKDQAIRMETWRAVDEALALLDAAPDAKGDGT